MAVPSAGPPQARHSQSPGGRAAAEPTSPLSAGRGPGGRQSILYAWEFGANLGHIGTFLPIARELRSRGSTVRWAVAHPHQAARLLPQAGFDWLQAPTMPEQRREGPPLNYADILLRFGYADGNDLRGLVVAWRELLRLAGADVVLADHAPTAILAARTLGIPAMLFGSGFFAPPPVHPTPYLRPETPHLEAALAALHGLSGSILIYAPGLSAELMQRYAAPHVAFSPLPVDLNKVARQADAGLTYASPAATVAFLMAGKPVLMIPGHLEQFLFAKRVEEMGAGLIQNPEQAPPQLAAMLRQVLTEPGFRANAGAFAAKYADFDQNAVMTHIVARIEQLAAANTHAGVQP